MSTHVPDVWLHARAYDSEKCFINMGIKSCCEFSSQVACTRNNCVCTILDSFFRLVDAKPSNLERSTIKPILCANDCITLEILFDSIDVALFWMSRFVNSQLQHKADFADKCKQKKIVDISRAFSLITYISKILCDSKSKPIINHLWSQTHRSARFPIAAVTSSFAKFDQASCGKEKYHFKGATTIKRQSRSTSL